MHPSTPPKSIVTLIKKLQQKKYIENNNLFVVEGEKSMIEIFAKRCKIKFLVCTSMFLKTYHLEIDTLKAQIFVVDKEKLAKLGHLQTNNAALAVCHKPTFHSPTNSDPCLAIDSIRDPGNLGTIVRTAHWFGIKNIICSQDTVDLYNPKVLQGFMGSFLHINIIYTNILKFLTGTHLPIFAASIDGDNMYKTQIPQKSIILIGNESRGINKSLYPVVSKRLTIPKHSTGINSLNVAIATGIICAHWCKNKQPT